MLRSPTRSRIVNAVPKNNALILSINTIRSPHHAPIPPPLGGECRLAVSGRRVNHGQSPPISRVLRIDQSVRSDLPSGTTWWTELGSRVWRRRPWTEVGTWPSSRGTWTSSSEQRALGRIHAKCHLVHAESDPTPDLAKLLTELARRGGTLRRIRRHRPFDGMRQRIWNVDPPQIRHGPARDPQKLSHHRLTALTLEGAMASQCCAGLSERH